MRTLIIAMFLTIGSAAPVMAGTLNITLQNKTFTPSEATVKAGDTIQICNRDPFYHSPFSYSRYNQFGSPKGVRISPGQCMTHVARNPTSESVYLKIFDELHAREKLTITVMPAGKHGLTGAWRITQTGNGSTYTGTLSITQNGGEISGSAEWDNHSHGTISGHVAGDRITFTISYGGGLIGMYEATVESGRMNYGSARSNKGGGAASWYAALE
jgi:plastocyanin